MDDYERVLDMRAGVLERSLVWRTRNGERLRVTTRRMVSFENKHLALMSYTVTPLDAAAELAFRSLVVDRQVHSEADQDAPPAGFDPRRSEDMSGALQPQRHGVHAMELLVVRREETGIRRYVHLGTGNYNDRTARQYTDIGYFTDDPLIAADVAGLFNVITGYVAPSSGSIELRGNNIGGQSPAAIANQGVRRTFQNSEEAGELFGADGELQEISGTERGGIAANLVRSAHGVVVGDAPVEAAQRPVHAPRPGIGGVTEGILDKGP